MDWTQATEQLSANLNKQHVKELSKGGRSLSYIEGWHAIAEANRIFGYDGWHRETIQLDRVAEHERQLKSGMGWSVSYIAKVRVTVDGRVREGVGAGHGMDRDLGLAHESAVKEAETDAMKRALMTFGNPFGLALYDKTKAMVTDEPLEGLTGDPDAKLYKTNGTTPKAQAAQKNNETYSTYEREIRMATSIEALKIWGELRASDIDKLPPAAVDALREEYASHKESLEARGP